MAVTRLTLRLHRELHAEATAQTDAATRALVAAWARAWDELAAQMAEAVDELADLAAEGRWPTFWQIHRNARLQQAMAAAAARLEELAGLTADTTVPAAETAVRGAAAGQADLITSQLPDSADDLLDALAAPRPDALDLIITRTTEDIHSAARPLADSAVEAMARALIRGVAVGDNPRAIARDMLRRVEGAFNGGLTRALTIARTEILDAHRAGAAAGQAANADVLGGWMWLAQLGPRCCPSCWAQHGSIHPLNERGPDDHQQGRCARMPVTKSWKQLGFAIKEPPSVVPAPRAAFRSLSHADQLAVMGPARLAALDGGDVGWADLTRRRSTPGWRDSWAPTPVRDLRRPLRAAR